METMYVKPDDLVGLVARDAVLLAIWKRDKVEVICKPGNYIVFEADPRSDYRELASSYVDQWGENTKIDRRYIHRRLEDATTQKLISVAA